MPSVTNRVKQVKQPRGGYINPKTLTKTVLGPGEEELKQTDFHAGTLSAAVDYLTRYMLGISGKEAFKIPLKGASVLKKADMHAMEVAENLISEVKGLDDRSIASACKLCGYDVCYRAGIEWYKPVEEIEPDAAAIENIRVMVNRSLAFFKQYGPITLDGPTFSGGYTDIVDAGDGDFLTEDAIWDMKVSAKPPTNKHTLQILMYYIMGKHSTVKEFETVHNLGFYNPRLNTVYLLDVNSIDPEIIREVETVVIGY